VPPGLLAEHCGVMSCSCGPTPPDLAGGRAHAGPRQRPAGQTGVPL